MQSTPANWDTYFTNPIHTTEYQIIISEKDGSGPITYGVNVIRSASIESALLTADMWIGNAVARCLTMTVLSEVDVPRMAKIVIQCRLGVGESYTDYMSIGTFWVDERDKGSLWTNLVCYDSMLMCDQPFINVDLEEDEWPLSMVEAVTEICARTALTLDARTTILTGTDYVVPYTNDLSMREVLGYIASCHGGNWTITPEGKLRLIVLSSPSEPPIHVLGQSIKSFCEMGNAILLSKLTMYDDAENAFSAGDDTEYHIEIDCPYATINIVNDLCNTADGILYGVKYTPFEATNARLNPLAELGDDISVGGVTSVLNKIEIRIGASYIADISCPGDEEVDHEYPYLSTIQRASNRAVKQNASYYGTTISRKDGLTIERLEDGSVRATAIFNSDVFAMRALENGVLKDKIYFDPAKGTYIFDGELSADIINALSAVITPNLYAEKATISELTVDRLDTSTKVQKYLQNDTSDVNYIQVRGQIIQFITASVVANYGASRVSSDSWDMVSDPQNDTYYSSAMVDESAGTTAYSGAVTANAWDAFHSGHIYRAIDANSYYKLTNANSSAFVSYDVYEVAEISVNYEQAQNRNGELLFWKDDTHTVATADETTYPVYVYLYNELVKAEYSFYYDNEQEEMIPEITLGAGNNVEGQPDVGKAHIWKGTDGLLLQYNYSAEKASQISVGEFVDANMRRIDSVNIDKTEGTIEITMEGETTPTVLDYTETADSMTFEWPDGHTATISIS